MKGLKSKVYNWFSKVNIDTGNHICASFLSICIVLMVCSVLCLVVLLKGENPLIICLCGAGSSMLSCLAYGFARRLHADYCEHIQKDNEV